MIGHFFLFFRPINKTLTCRKMSFRAGFLFWFLKIQKLLKYFLVKVSNRMRKSLRTKIEFPSNGGRTFRFFFLPSVRRGFSTSFCQRYLFLKKGYRCPSKIDVFLLKKKRYWHQIISYFDRKKAFPLNADEIDFYAIFFVFYEKNSTAPNQPSTKPRTQPDATRQRPSKKNSKT